MSKKYKLIFTREFLRRLRRLNKSTQVRVIREIKTLEINPFAGKRLRGRLSGLLSFRVRNYRIIYQVSEEQIVIRTIGHRKTIYER
ncbi:type II toxin-antitoxin system RelE/ParE family toxin [Candidatus Bathyarchaeota archaeon]|nr:MAG: type II toxin-antitoxin system RelE/ParE family toxin [Candidatus Bathyarchaeota archaeon]